MEKEEINEKFKNSAISHDSKLLFLSKELKDIKLKCEQQAKEIKSLKQTISESQKCNTSLQDFTKIHSLYNSPSQKIYSKNERLSVYQEKKMKFNKSPKNYNYMKFSNASKIVIFYIFLKNSSDAENFIISNQTSVTDLIYPFSKPNEYYNRLSKNPKSSNLYNYENLYFKDLINLSEDSLLRFKRCCLFQKHVLFDNGTLQIGTVSSYCTSEYNEYLRLSLFIGNMKETLIESISMNYFFLKDLNISIKQKLPDFIANKTQIKQELMVQYTMVPYQLLFNKLNYNCGFNSFEVSFALPLTINKFLRARYIEIEQFQKEWQINKSLSLKSNFFLVEEKLIKNDIYDFKTFFIDLVDLKPWKLDYYKSGIGDYKLAGSFKYGEEKYEKILWFKIVMTPKKEVAFQVFCQQPNFKEYFLNTLIFLFKKGI